MGTCWFPRGGSGGTKKRFGRDPETVSKMKQKKEPKGMDLEGLGPSKPCLFLRQGANSVKSTCRGIGLERELKWVRKWTKKARKRRPEAPKGLPGSARGGL